MKGGLESRSFNVAACRMKWYPCDMKKSNRLWVGVIAAATAVVALGLLWIFGAFGDSGGIPFFAKDGPEWTRTEYSPEDLRTFTMDDPNMEERGIIVNESLFLINSNRPVSKDRVFSIGYYKTTDVMMNRAMHEDYSRLSAAVKSETGDHLYVMSSYRSFDDQRVLFEADPMIAAEPGKSEHHSGLALDVYVFEFAGAGFLKSDAGKFVNEHCYEYGFIIRYPKGKEDMTGIPYEPWHIRYVGQPHARYIALNRLTLEEYIERLGVDKFFIFEGWVISRQAGPELRIPLNATEIMVSEDNTGYYIITAKVE